MSVKRIYSTDFFLCTKKEMTQWHTSKNNKCYLQIIENTYVLDGCRTIFACLPFAGEDLFTLGTPSQLQLMPELGCVSLAWGSFHFLASAPETLLASEWVFISFTNPMGYFGFAVNPFECLKQQL